MSAAAVAAEYLHSMNQSPSLWTHEVSQKSIPISKSLTNSRSNFDSSTCALLKKSFKRNKQAMFISAGGGCVLLQSDKRHKSKTEII